MAELHLQIARARPHDVGRGVARISAESLRAAGLASGAVIEIVGKRRRSRGARQAAGLYAFRDSIDVEVVGMACFETALADSHASVSEDVEREYETIVAELKRESPTGRRRIGFSVASPTAGADATSS